MNYGFFFLIFFISSLLAYFIQNIFILHKKFDDFNSRSSHSTLATRTGGIGIFATLLLISTYHYFNNIVLFDYSLFIPLGIMFTVGVYDDLYNADFKLKFLLQIIVAKIIIDQGYVITNYHGLFGFYEVPWVLAQLSTLFVFIVIINSINFIDGIDGLAITEVIKTILLIEFFSLTNSPLFILGVMVIFSLIPLYYFNFKKKRKVFLGDGGSLLLGTVISIYIFHVLGNDYTFKPVLEINKVAFSILVILYPLVDLLRVFVLRIGKGNSPFNPDQKHLHHFLLKKTKSHQSVVLIIMLINTISVFILFSVLKTVPF